MRAGPKRAVTVPPLDLSGLPAQRGRRCVAFVEGYLRVPRGVGALKPVRLRPWQRRIVADLFAPGVRQGLVSIPRGNGKSALAAFLALYALFADRVEGAQVLTIASDERQARIVFNLARRMIELNDALADRVQVFSDRVYAPQTDSTLAPLPAEPDALQGWDPSLVVVDELHVVTDDVLEAMQLAAGKRDRSLLLAISTPAGDRDGPMFRLVEHGRAGGDPAFVLVEHSAPEGCAIDDEAAWHTANPALGDFLAIDALRSTLKTTREESFRRFRLGQWVGQTGAWLPWGTWDALESRQRVADLDGAQVVLGFDGSASGDSTALVGCTVSDVPHVFVLGIWANPGDARWRVPRAEVDRAVDAAFDRFDVAELAADPWGWRSEIEAWAARHERVIEWPTNVVSRMAPATDRFYQLVVTGGLTHDGNPDLAAHLAHCVARPTPQGDLVTKDRRMSPRKIDAAVAAIVAADRAAHHNSKPKRRRRMAVV